MIGSFIEWFVTVFLARLFPSRYRVIPRAQDGEPMLRQFKVFSIGKERPRGVPPWWHVSCFLQSFQIPELPHRCHVHRWRRMLSFVLSGGFVELRYSPTGIWAILHKAFSVYTMNDEVVHHVLIVNPQTWTLFFMFGRARHGDEGGWGYFDAGHGRFRYENYRPWDEEIPAERKIGAR